MTNQTEEPQNMAEAIAQAQATMAAMGMNPTLAAQAAQMAGQVTASGQNPFVQASVQQQAAELVTDTNDFSASPTAKTPIDFYLDGDTFYARPRIGGGVVLGLARVATVEDTDQQVDLIRMFLRKVLLPGSYTLFIARLDDLEYTDPVTGQRYNVAPDEDGNPVLSENGEPYPDLEPIELTQVLNVFRYLIGKYTRGDAEKGFPTPASSASAGGSGNTGTSSSAPAPSMLASTPATPL